ncbi:MAG TPA: hypothetical protein VHS31_02475, partial [Tepidisphaeraceae bacterium]|nr:hypothetical protein [Tepidisphaeraceae bacterium]
MIAEQRRKRYQIILGAVAAMSYVSCVQATTYIWSGSVSGNNWNTAANWTTDMGANVVPPQSPTPPDVTDLLFTGSLTVNQTSTQNIGTIDVNSIVINGQPTGAATFTISASSTGDQFINLGAGGLTDQTPGSAGNGGTVSLTGGTNRKIVLTADQTWRNDNTFGILSQRRTMEGAFKITKVGAGTIELQADNANWTGGLQIDEGVIRTSNFSDALGTGPITVNTTNSVAISASGSAQTDQIVAGPVSLAGTGNFSLQGSWNFQFNGNVTLLSDKNISVGNIGTFNGGVVGSFGLT